MTLNDYYYNTVAKQRASELRAVAAEERLARIARRANKEKRADQREARRLQAAVHGRSGLLQALRSLFVPDQPTTNSHEAATTDQAVTTDQEETSAEKPAPTASR